MSRFLRAWRTAWEAFWFRPTSALPLALFRIALGLILLAEAAVTAPDLLLFYGPHAIVSRATAALELPGPHLNVLAWLPATNAAVIGFFAVYVAAVLGLTLGWRTRTCAFVAYVGLTSMHHANLLVTNSSDNLLRLFALLLSVSPAGARLSLDAARAPKPAEEALYAPWAQRLIQLQLSLMYMSAFAWKTTGARWRDGTAVYYATHVAQYRGFPLPFLLTNAASIHALTWGTMGLELALGLLMWVRTTRYAVLAAGVLFHLGLSYAMNLPFFEAVVLAPYLLFVDAADWRRLAAWRPRRKSADGEAVGAMETVERRAG